MHESLIVTGRPIRFEGSTTVSGFKHSLVLVVAAAALSAGELRVDNVPEIVEARALTEILNSFGASISLDGTSLRIDSTNLRSDGNASGLDSSIHGSAYLIPSLLKKLGVASISAGGGCALGSGPNGVRPSGHYVSVLRRFGVIVEGTEMGQVRAQGRRWKGTDIDLREYIGTGRENSENHYSGASKMAILMAAGASSRSTLTRPYLKAEVHSLLEVLACAGVQHQFLDSDQSIIVIDPPKSLEFGGSAQVTLPPDLIEIVTLMTAAALYATDSVRIGGQGIRACSTMLTHEFVSLRRFGVDFSTAGRELIVRPSDRLIRPTTAVSGHYPSPYSDVQPFFALIAAWAAGESTVVDEVWPLRFSYAEGLRKLGVDIVPVDKGIVIRGRSVPRVRSAQVEAHDLRAAAVLTLAGMAIDGRTKVVGTHHLARGYADLIGSLTSLGAHIEGAA